MTRDLSVQTHWEGCELVHHACAVGQLLDARAEVERLKSLVDDACSEIERLKDVIISDSVRVWSEGEKRP